MKCPGNVLPCSDGHAGQGSLDESPRRLSHEELAVALLLAKEGHRVVSVPEGPPGRHSDLQACGLPVEVKAFRPDRLRQAGRPRAASVFNKLVQAEGQAAHVVLLAYGSGLSASVAREGVAAYAAFRRVQRLSTVRVIGDGFDMTWARVATRSLEQSRCRRLFSTERGLGL